jgi:PAS domain S-box-containing protein
MGGETRMTSQEEIFARQIEAVLHSLRALLQRSGGSSDPQAVVAEAMQIIAGSLEELGSVAENLRRARDKLELRVQERTAELSKANEALRYQADLLANVHDAIIATDEQGIITVWNRAAEDTYGWKAGEALGQRLAELVHQEFIDADPAELRKSLVQTGRWRGEIRQYRRDGTAWVGDVITVALNDEEGRGIGYVSVNRDISERKRAEEMLRHYVARLEILHNIDRAILAAQSSQEIANVALRDIRQLLVPCQRASVWLFDLDANEAVRLAASVEGETHPGVGERMSLDDLGDITPLRQGQYQVVDDLDAVAGRSRLDERLLAEGMRSSIGVPLVSQGKLMGSLYLRANAPSAFSAEQAEIVRRVADPLAIAIRNARLFDEVRAGREQLQALSQRLIEAQETERRRVSRELHDEAGQSLTALKISLELMQADLWAESEKSRQSFREAATLADETMERIRSLAQGLRPPELDVVGLNPTLEDYCHDFAERTRLSIDYAGTELPALPDAVTICFYRVLQEALTNVAKHAHASHVRVALRCDADTLSLSVEDDGQGFDVSTEVSVSRQPRGIGLLGMRERLELLGGRLEIKSQPGQGTYLVAYAPREDGV